MTNHIKFHTKIKLTIIIEKVLKESTCDRTFTRIEIVLKENTCERTFTRNESENTLDDIMTNLHKAWHHVIRRSWYFLEKYY